MAAGGREALHGGELTGASAAGGSAKLGVSGSVSEFLRDDLSETRDRRGEPQAWLQHRRRLRLLCRTRTSCRVLGPLGSRASRRTRSRARSTSADGSGLAASIGRRPARARGGRGPRRPVFRRSASDVSHRTRRAHEIPSSSSSRSTSPDSGSNGRHGKLAFPVTVDEPGWTSSSRAGDSRGDIHSVVQE